MCACKRLSAIDVYREGSRGFCRARAVAAPVDGQARDRRTRRGYGWCSEGGRRCNVSEILDKLKGKLKQVEGALGEQAKKAEGLVEQAKQKIERTVENMKGKSSPPK
jgi:uncharacterized protein YjbJ (UPF0337 family)